MGDLSRRIEQTRSNAKRKRLEIDNKRTKMDNCKKRIDDLMSTLEEIEGQKLNVEERTKRLEKMIEVYFTVKNLFGLISRGLIKKEESNGREREK